MAAPARMDELRKDRKLAHYVLKGRALGRQFGSGAYGSLEEVSFNHNQAGQTSQFIVTNLFCMRAGGYYSCFIFNNNS